MIDTNEFKLTDLAAQARLAAWNREHALSSFELQSDTTAVAYCYHCGKEAYINSRPMPNEIDISGEAVALNCEEN